MAAAIAASGLLRPRVSSSEAKVVTHLRRNIRLHVAGSFNCIGAHLRNEFREYDPVLCGTALYVVALLQTLDVEKGLTMPLGTILLIILILLLVGALPTWP
jgi:Protein of unknown function (DUF3309)